MTLTWDDVFAVQDDPGESMGELAARFKTPYGTVQGRINKLVQQGMATKGYARRRRSDGRMVTVPVYQLISPQH